MPLAKGARLGPYEIVATLGTGGMGEVYSARDTRLGRTVAIKILPAEFAADARLKLRFDHEAKAISALNHPHICALHDVGRENGFDYLVMEYCEGKTLAKRLASGPLPIEQVIQYGVQIADALDKAHRAGIVHRDLKPANIMITKSGVKLLDFGLAKQHTDSTPEEATAQQVTEEREILGTIQYMAPELFQGNEADARSDIFALGLVLYEMATGKPAFSATSKASLIAAILEHEAPHVGGSAPLDRLIRACLEKDPSERIQTAHDVLLQLRWMTDVEPTKVAGHPMRSVLLAMGLIMLGAVGAITWRSIRPNERPIRSARFQLQPPTGVLVAEPGPDRTLAVSPDGEW
ncbi:MAG TPA: serine/threonine-protein kinase, partial [Thermoanaerobaculia bacterium]|nr:serine/threonine-protein kinase [Thermoanaerobaculia bacterium]